MRLGKTSVVALVALVTLLCAAAPAFASGLTPTEQLGKALFFDKNLSDPVGQSCASCHAPKAGWTGPTSSINAAGAVYPGAVATRFGNRKPPTAAYGGDSPVLDDGGGLWLGGMFWDGRATGWTLGDPLAEQALGPFLNPLEQNMASAAAVIDAVKASDYADLFVQVWGDIWPDADTDVAVAYEAVGRSIAAYERSSEVNPFSSKYDAWKAGKVRLTLTEKWGYQLFTGKGKCDLCHVEPLFTDFSYDNLGVPKNPKNPFYDADPAVNPDGDAWIDPGLGGFLKSEGMDYAAEWGKHKVPTLRNVDKRPTLLFVKAYGHNGYFKSLWKIVHFYNTRDVRSWPAPEVAENVNTTELGNLGLCYAEELAIVAFMKTLSDGYAPAGCH